MKKSFSDICESGVQLFPNGTCGTDCPRGYYKDNSVGPDYEFNECTLCPIELITAGEKSTSINDCNVRKYTQLTITLKGCTLVLALVQVPYPG